MGKTFEMHTRNLLIAAAGLAITLGGASVASAQDDYAANHPRRAEVQARVEHQHDRIDRRLADGEISGARAHRLHRADYRIARQEHRFAMHHHGRISRAEQARLNRQEARVGHRIG
jgi:hypothetical protein